MASIAFTKFESSLVSAKILLEFNVVPNLACTDPRIVEQSCLKAAVASAVGSWEGYLEGAIREFVSKTRVNAHRRAWTLIAQFESLVDKLAADLNTPNWDKGRDLLIIVTGMDPYSSWVWTPKFVNQTDTKNHFDGILKVRHAFAHGFNVPGDVSGLIIPGVLDIPYSQEAIEFIKFFAAKTDALLEYELMHRHGCLTGWT